MRKQPNVLYIMSDDHSANAISCYGSILSDVFKTPNMDRLYEEGTKLQHFYSTNAICTPARASIMTGQYGHINGVRTLSDHWDPTQGPNLAAIFQDNGYETAMFGKWHLHCEPLGFDDYKYLSGCHGQGTYWDPEFEEKDLGRKVHKGYVTDVITDMTTNFLDNRDTSKPFFLMCHHKAPHDFWEFAKRHEHLFDGKDIPVPDSLFEDRSHRSEASRDFGSSVTPRSKVRSLYQDFQAEDYVTGPLKIDDDMTFEQKGLAAYQKYLKDYLRTVAGIDDSVGVLLDKLEAIGELNNTIIIYTSDQGMFLGEHDYQDKRWSYEESLRAPFLIRYPEKIPSKVTNTNLMANIDVAPTLLDFCGISVPKAMQGVSQVPVLLQKEQEDLRSVIYFRYWMNLAHRHHNPAHFGIRTKQYKFIYYYGKALDAAGAVHEDTPTGFELYDMVNDPQEMNNIYEDEARGELVQSLMEQLHDARKTYMDLDENYPNLLSKE
ncbi:sulfatase [Vallitalea pronyensis]|uniref:Sulfatase n=1 Tax=Vallitalea pronyensis TaxID=1348613 RepID=A0A8J8MMV6_9FIRM|nr:sulfatase [Vallitalea pronyensis]QUI24680.1 sulfatase [Vallitalea pronyensis]